MRPLGGDHLSLRPQRRKALSRPVKVFYGYLFDCCDAMTVRLQLGKNWHAKEPPPNPHIQHFSRETAKWSRMQYPKHTQTPHTHTHTQIDQLPKIINLTYRHVSQHARAPQLKLCPMLVCSLAWEWGGVSSTQLKRDICYACATVHKWRHA